MTLDVSVLLPTHAPHAGRLARTLEGLRGQTLPTECWELLIVDNASPADSALARIDLSWHPQAKVLREERLGLTHARLAGIRAAAGELLVLVDDDNILALDYLAQARTLFDKHANLGAAGGKTLPEWEVRPQGWMLEFTPSLAVRDLGDDELRAALSEPRTYPLCSPVGAGMALRREAALAYAAKVGLDPVVMDRQGGNLSSGGDNDIVLTVLEAGWDVGYFPQLQLTHLIPAARLKRDYLARLVHSSSRSWVEVLAQHGIRPWPAVAPWTVPARKLRAWWRYRAWRDPASYVRWRGACGTFEGQARLRTAGLEKKP